MKIIRKKMSRDDLRKMAKRMYGNLVKAVVDVERKVMAVNGELHADEETVLLEDGSKSENLWGINLYPDKTETDWIEYDSVINLKPSLGNRSRGVEDPEMRRKIDQIVQSLLE